MPVADHRAARARQRVGKPGRRPLAVSLLCAAAVGVTTPLAAQVLNMPHLQVTGLEGEPDELAAWTLSEAGRHIGAREQAEKVLKKRPQSFVAHFVLGKAQHYGEANFPRALFHYDQALSLYEARFGVEPDTDGPWRWHAKLLRRLAAVHGSLEHHEVRLGYIARFNERYQPHLIAERAWPLMKLERYDEARLAASMGMHSGRPGQRTLSLNALCAIEFEAGNDGQSYEACKLALDDARAQGRPVSAVDLTNFAEASRSLFKLDEAEAVVLEATKARVAWYGNPWMELSELYTRQARFTEALAALRRVPEYRLQRPPHVRDADRNELWRAVASFLLTISRPLQARAITGPALLMPDRRGHNSRDPSQDRVVVALLDRRARMMAAEMRMERAAVEPWHAYPGALLDATWHRLSAWHSGRLAERLLDDDSRLVGSFRLGTSKSAIMPPWLVGELVEVLGTGVVDEAVRRASGRDERPSARPYYASVRAESAAHAGRWDAALSIAASALQQLGPGEVLLRARVQAIAAEAARRTGQMEDALSYLDAAFQSDPGVFRRLSLEVPVVIEVRGESGEMVAEMLADSPRLDVSQAGLRLRVEAARTGGTACLSGPYGIVIGCGRASAKADEDAQQVARNIVRAFHADVFAPRVPLTNADINSLDGANLVGKEALERALEF